MGHLGFSYIGFVYLLLLFIPNIIWAIDKNKINPSSLFTENRVLLLLERSGQILTTVIVLVFNDFNPTKVTPRLAWLVVSFIALALYEVSWVRYFKGNRSVNSLYCSFLRIPIPLASLPVIAFLLLGIYGKVIWLVVSVFALGIGHIGIHLQHRLRLES